MPADCVVRAAASADTGPLTALDADDYPWTCAQLDRACGGEAGQRLLVLEYTGELAGYLAWALVLDEASIYRVLIAGQHRQRGLGRVLLDAGLAAMRAQGARRCLLEVRASNHAARALYESRGFALDGLRKGYYPAPAGREDALLMSLSLEVDNR